ncbi:hypothetical protein ACYULU_16025 [Breznakiellaceae bacterium SP9]
MKNLKTLSLLFAALLAFLPLTALRASPGVSLSTIADNQRAEFVMKAFAKAYPDRIGPAEYRDGDWAVPIRGVYYYYANGKLLPQNLRSQEADYAPTDLYVYPKDLPRWRKPSTAEAARYKAVTESRQQSTRKRSTFFFLAHSCGLQTSSRPTSA